MSKNTFSNIYDDDNIPEVDLPRDNTSNHSTNSMSNSNKTNASDKPNYNVEPLPESSRPRKDGPGGA